MKRPASRSKEAAETLAIQALAFIAEEPDRLAAFLGATGLSPDRIRESANQPHFLRGVLEHMLSNESLVVAFADNAGIDPADIARACGAIGGDIGGDMGSHWERDLP
jgi:hypothetical protein